MRRLLPPDEFLPWFDRFLPRLVEKQPATLFKPATVTDRTDGKIAHLDGLNLSRAWCWRSLGDAMPVDDPRVQLLTQRRASIWPRAFRISPSIIWASTGSRALPSSPSMTRTERTGSRYPLVA